MQEIHSFVVFIVVWYRSDGSFTHTVHDYFSDTGKTITLRSTSEANLKILVNNFHGSTNARWYNRDKAKHHKVVAISYGTLFMLYLAIGPR